MSNVENRKRVICAPCATLQAAHVPYLAVKEIISSSVSQLQTSKQLIFSQALSSINSQNNSITQSSDRPIQCGCKLFAHKEVITNLKQNFNAFNSAKPSLLSPVEQLKLISLATLAATPLFVSDHRIVTEGINKLVEASTPKQVREFSQQLTTTIETQQNQLVVQSVKIACEKASRDAGFKEVQTQNKDGIMRIIAQDPNEHVLVSEIHQDKQTKAINIVTETIGLKDTACNQMIDEYNKSLAQSGVVYESGDRKFTGGVSQLTFSKKWEEEKSKSGIRKINRKKISILVGR